MSSLRRVLIVDSDSAWINQIGAQLVPLRESYHLHALSSLAQAERLLRVEPFDLVLIPSQLLSSERLAHLRWSLENNVPPTVIFLTNHDGNSPAQDDSTARRQISKNAFDKDLPLLLADLFPLTPVVTTEAREVHSLKVALVGDSSVGKTTLMFRLRTGKFRDLRLLTVGVDFHTYEFDLNTAHYRMVVWDLGGQDRFRVMRRTFYRGSKIVALLFDVTNHATFYDLPRWWREVREELGDATVTLVGNKIDQPREISRAEAESLAGAWGIPYFEISCQSGENVHELFVQLAQLALTNSQ